MTMSPNPDELLFIGTIVGPFGIKGQVKLHAATDQPEHIKNHVRDLFIGKDRTLYTLTRLFQHKPSLLILTLRGIESRDAAEDLRGSEVYIREAEAAPLGEDEYYLHQLPGLLVLQEDGTEIGTVKDVIETGANEVLVVSRPGQADALIPMVHEFVVGVDFAAGRLKVRPIEGLL